MKKKIGLILGVYNLILAIGAINIGVMMVKSDSGIFEEFPTEWVLRTPFKNWIIIGIIAIVIFGMGNIVASILSFKENYILSAVMGGILLICIILQAIILGEWYLASVEFLILSIIQIFISGYLYKLKGVIT